MFYRPRGMKTNITFAVTSIVNESHCQGHETSALQKLVEKNLVGREISSGTTHFNVS